MFLAWVFVFLFLVFILLRPVKIAYENQELQCTATLEEASKVNLPAVALAAKKVVVTGGASFLGRHVAEAVRAAGVPTVVLLDEKKTFDSLDMQFVQKGLQHKEEVMTAVEDADVVIHCASAPSTSSKKDAKTLNVDHTRNLVEACGTMEVGTLIIVSSAGIMFDGSNQAGLDETAPKPAKFSSPAHRTRWEAEEIVLAAGKDRSSLQTASIRACAAFGPREEGLFPGAIAAAQSGKASVVGSGTNTVDVTYVGNVAYSVILAMKALEAPNSEVNGQAFIINNKEPVQLWDFVAMIQVGLGYEPAKNRRPEMPILIITTLVNFVMSLLGKGESSSNPVALKSNTRHRYYNSSKAAKVLGYVPVWSVQQGLRLTLRAFRSYKNPKASVAVAGSGAGGLPEYTAEEVAQHNSQDDAWLIISDQVYDLTDYLDQHPGGDAILRNVGGDATAGFHGPQHPSSVHTTVKSFLIGTLKKE